MQIRDVRRRVEALLDDGMKAGLPYAAITETIAATLEDASKMISLEAAHAEHKAKTGSPWGKDADAPHGDRMPPLDMSKRPINPPFDPYDPRVTDDQMREHVGKEIDNICPSGGPLVETPFGRLTHREFLHRKMEENLQRRRQGEAYFPWLERTTKEGILENIRGSGMPKGLIDAIKKSMEEDKGVVVNLHFDKFDDLKARDPELHERIVSGTGKVRDWWSAVTYGTDGLPPLKAEFLDRPLSEFKLCDECKIRHPEAWEIVPNIDKSKGIEVEAFETGRDGKITPVKAA